MIYGSYNNLTFLGVVFANTMFFLVLEPNTELVHGKFLRNVLFHALPAALTSVILVE